MNTHKIFNLAIALIFTFSLVGIPTQNAYADSGPLCYVDDSATGANDGTSWADAFTDLQSALTDAGCIEIWVAAGIYKPTNSADRTISFVLKNGVEIHGGFAGTETQLDQRNWQANVTILSGDIDNNDSNTDENFIAETWNDLMGNNSYHVVTGNGTDSTAVLDGLVITAGQANGSVSAQRSGGGMLNDNGRLTLANITFSGNTAIMGGGMDSSVSSSPTLTNVSFSGNSASSGGGMSINGSSTPTLTNVTFIGNQGGNGGGMYNRYSNPTLTNVTFSGNSASNGGGLHNFHYGNSKLTNVIFSDNSAYYGGGINNRSNSNPTLINVTFNGNRAYTSGGGISNMYTSNPMLTNVILWGNSAPNGAGIHNDNSTSQISYSNIQGCGGSGSWNDACGMDSGGNIEADPLFDAPSNDLHLLDGSPAIDSGTNSNCPATDFGGVLRPQDGNNDGTAMCDMGAFEYIRPADSTPPVITPLVSGTLGSNGWYTSNVTVTWDFSDPESGNASSSGCELTTLSTETTSVTLTCTATNGAGLVSFESVTVKIDKTPPVITWSGNIENGDRFFFDSVPPALTCSAEDIYSGIDGVCAVSGYVATVGTHTLTASAKDLAGNTASEYRTYTILPWTLKGFYQPVDMNGVYNIVRGGSTVPLKFEIFAGSIELTDVAYINSLTYAQISCDATATTDEIETIATGGTSLRYDTTAGQFVYNWKTPSIAGRCYRVTMTAIDGSLLAAYFRLK